MPRTAITHNTLFYSDNPPILPEYIANASINVILREQHAVYGMRADTPPHYTAGFPNWPPALPALAFWRVACGQHGNGSVRRTGTAARSDGNGDGSGRDGRGTGV